MEPISGAPEVPAGSQATASLPDFVLRQFLRPSPEPNHRQLYRILEEGVRSRRLPAGLRLPPTREMARALGIARNTVVHAYDQLTLEGFLSSRVGRGTFVADIGVPPAPAAQPVAHVVAAAGADEAAFSTRGASVLAHAAASPHQWGAFMPGVPEVRQLPVAAWLRLQARAWRSAVPEHFSYATGAGAPELRTAIADYLQSTRGVRCDAHRVVVTSGTQQSLTLVAQLLADPGDRVWIEDPGYWGARSVFRACGLRLVPVPLDEQGLAPGPELRRAPPPRLIFVSPSHQYPTGVLMSHARRTQLLHYAAARGSWIVEDDYDSEFRYGARPLPALQGLDEHQRVVYLGTFSKTLFPSLRIAYLVLPPELVEPFTRALVELFREGQTLQQRVLAAFIAEGHYARHVRRMRRLYAARRALLIEGLRRRFGAELRVLGGDAGLHLALALPEGVDDAALARETLARGVVTRPLSLYSLRRPAPMQGLLLGYGSVANDDIGPALEVVADTIEDHLRRGPREAEPTREQEAPRAAARSRSRRPDERD